MIALGAAGALLLAPVAALASQGAATTAKSASSKAIAAVLGSGVMTKFPNGFRPNDPATRLQLALALHRSIPRIAVQENLGSLNASSPATNIGDVRIKIDGAPNKLQGVLISVQMQLDHDNALAGNCGASFTLTRDASPSNLDFWSQELYSGPASGEEDNIAWTWFVTQKTQKSSNYHLLASNSCTQTLFTDADMMTAQAFPLAGSGKPHVAAKAKQSTTPKHDQ
jgi:hypothetical protein